MEITKTKKKLTRILIIAMFLAVFTTATKASTTAYVGETIKIGDISYNVTAGSTKNTIILIAESSVIPLDLGKTITSGKYKVTLTGVEQDTSKAVETYKYTVDIEETSEDITITRDAPSETYYGSTLNITYVIKNTGTNNINNIMYEETIPPMLIRYKKPVEIVNNNEHEISYYMPPNKVIWHLSLAKGEERRLVLTLKVMSTETDISEINLNKGKLSFNSFGETAEKEIKSETIKISKPVSLTITANNMNFEEEASISVGLKNNLNNEQVTITSLNIWIPKNEIISYNGLTKASETAYIWKGTLSKNQEKTLNITFKPHEAGKINITAKAALSYLGKAYEIQETKEITINIDKIEQKINLPKTSFSSNDNINFTINLKNKNTEFLNVETKISSEFFDDINFVYLKFEKNANIIKPITRKLPWTDKDTTFKIRLNTTFKTKYGQAFTETTEKEITVSKKSFEKAVDFDFYSIKKTTDNTTNTTSIAAVLNITKLSEFEYGTITLSICSRIKQYTTSWGKNKSEMPELRITLPENCSEATIKASLKYKKEENYFYISKEAGISKEESTKTKGENKTASIADTTKNASEKTNITMNSGKKGEAVNRQANLSQLASKDNENKKDVEKTIEKIKAVPHFAEIAVISIIILMVIVIVFVQSLSRNENEENKENIELEKIKQSLEKEKIKIASKEGIRSIDVPEPTNDFNELERFIQESRKSNIPDSEIRSRLLGRGWIEDVVDTYLKNE